VLTPPQDPPAGCALPPASIRGQLVDAVVEADDALMEKFLEQGGVTIEELLAALPKALAVGTVIPVFCVAAKKGLGVAEVLEALADYAPGPGEGKHRTAVKKQGGETAEIELKPDPAAECVGQVFKTVSDKFVGTLSFIRFFSGSYKAEQPLINARTERGA